MSIVTEYAALNIPFLTLDFSKQNGVSVNFRTSLRRHNVIYTHATFSRTKESAKWPVTAATHSIVTSCMQIRAQLRLFQVKAMFKQHVNLMIWTWILRLQTASRNEFPCKNVRYITVCCRWLYRRGVLECEIFDVKHWDISASCKYSKTCVKRSLKNRQNKGLND